MSNRTMLKEAIADAKTIKETAIANAKAALEESFTPHIKSMLATKLQEMDKEDELDEAKKDDSKDKVEEMDAPSFDRKSGPAITPDPKKVGTSTVQEGEKEELDEEVELDEILSQLDEEMSDELEEGKKEEIDEAELDEAKKEDLDESLEDVTEAEEEEIDMDADAEGEVDMEDEEIDLEDMTEDDLKGFIEDVIKSMVEDGELEPGDEFEADEEEGEGDMEMDVDADIEITEDEDIEEHGAGKWKIGKKPQMEEAEDLDEAKKDDLDEAKKDDLDEAKKDEIDEALAEVEKLKAEINEVNLLNAKLLYTNKLFRAKNLSEAQKVKVLESFDKATSVKETKLVFETLSEGIKSTPKTKINEVKGSASKATGVIAESKQPIVESNDMVSRFQKLAGII